MAPLVTIRSASVCAWGAWFARPPPAATAAAAPVQHNRTATRLRLRRLRIRQLLHRSERLIDRLIGVRGGGRIGVCDGDPSKRFAADLARRLPFRPVRIP